MSIISDIFYAIQKTNTKCSRCNLIKYNFQAYFFLVFPLEEIRKYKIQLLQNQFNINNPNFMNINPNLYQQNLLMFQANLQNINSVDFNDCFLNNQKTEYFTGENAMYCNNCKQTLPSYYQSFLYTCPEILVIVLNRGQGIEFNVKYEFQEYLNISNYVEKKEFGYEYNLIGVVTHIGENGANGHFISFNKSPIDQNWYKYNDEFVSKVINFKREVIDYAMPYILFYQKINK
jgi:ubiquitin C-terminal hydrolase